MKQAKKITIKQALDLVKDNDQIIFGMAANEPQLFANHIHEVYDRLKKPIEVTSCLPVSQDAPYIADPKYRDKIKINSWFHSPGIRRAAKYGGVTFIPNHLHLAGKKRLDTHKVNIFVSAASLPDKHGYISLSLSNVYEKRSIQDADITILEINPNFPRTLGDLEVHISDVDYIIEASYDAPIIPDIALTEKDIIIGKQIAKMIPNGACLQLGIGGIPNAVAASLKGKKDLGIHTEMFTSGMQELIECGAVTNMKKQTHIGKSVATFAYGSKKLYDYIDDNPAVLLLNGLYVNDPYIIGLNDNQVSINATLEMSLDGQCASESIGVNQFSGTGGQADTAIGAQNSKGGMSFIALYSTAMVKDPKTGIKKETSKIVPILKPGAAVSLSRNDVDYVVTEYGMVALRGTTVSERAKLLISIAHPDFREQLTKDALKYGFISE